MKTKTKTILSMDDINAIFRLWTLPAKTKSLLDSFFILYWSKDYFIKNYNDNQYYILKDNIKYEIKLMESIDSIYDNQIKQIRLSFRECKHLDIAIVLVSFKY